MSNMSHCRFQNTAQDLADCYYNHIDDEDLSPDEKRARLKLIKLCIAVAAYCEDGGIQCPMNLA